MLLQFNQLCHIEGLLHMKITTTILLALALPWLTPVTSPVFVTQSGRISFISEAPLEVVRASSREMKGALDTQNKTVAFNVDVVTFQGFNGQLQREHFNENYLESGYYPKAFFTGKIIETVNLSLPGTYDIRAKGKLNVHGIEQERIIRAQLVVSSEGIILRSKFTVLLADHNITIPRIVNQKIAEEITVEVEALLTPKP